MVEYLPERSESSHRQDVQSLTLKTFRMGRTLDVTFFGLDVTFQFVQQNVLVVTFSPLKQHRISAEGCKTRSLDMTFFCSTKSFPHQNSRLSQKIRGSSRFMLGPEVHAGFTP